MSSPNSEDMRKQASDAVGSAVDQVRTPLLAALGAGNLASQAVTDVVNKAKSQVTEGSETARKNLEDMPSDVEELRERLDPTELRKVIDEYTEAAMKLYNKLAESGEEAWDKILAQPQVKNALEQLEEALENAQGKAEDVSSDVRERVDDILSKVTKRTRSSGEKAARTVQRVATDTADNVRDAGEDLAHETRSATRKAASRTEPRTANTTRRSTSSTTKKSTGTTSKSSTGTSRSTGGSSSSGSSKESGTAKDNQ